MRRRIVALAVVGSTLALVLFGLPLAAATARYLMTEERYRLQNEARVIAGQVAPALDDERAPVLPPVDDDMTVAVYDFDRHRVAGTGPDDLDGELGAVFEGRGRLVRSDDQLIVAVPVTRGDHLVGAVRTASDDTRLHRRVALIWAGMAGLAMLSVGAVGLVARWQARRLAAPLSAMADSAGRLGDGDFSVRVPPADIAEIDSLGRALNTTAGRLDDLIARERAFSAEASHQLRTPLAGLRLRLEAALDGDPVELPAAVRAAIGDADRVERTIDELLTLARRGGGGVGGGDGGAEPTDVRGLLDEARRGWSGRPDVGGRPLVLDVETDLPASLASAAAVRHVLHVLLDNAAAHGSGTVSVTARSVTAPAGEALAIDVGDEGTGIEVSEAEIFARRASDADGRGAGHGAGHGIGLALARRLAEAEGGRLRLARPVPPVFTILLPVPPKTSGADQEPGAGLS